MKKLLITGGAGFIGSNFVKYIANKYPEYKISVVDSLTYAGSLDNLPTDFLEGTKEGRKFWYGNVCNGELISNLVADAELVVHFAAESHVTRSIFDNLEFFHTDVIGTQVVTNSILKNQKGIERFVHISTSEVYGTATTEMMKEDHPLNPMSPYAAAKTGADRLVYSYVQTYDMPAVIIRPFNNYGRQQHLEKVIPRFITSALLGEPLSVHGEGDAARDFIHVDDTCRAIDLVLHAPESEVVGEVFNVCSGQDRSVRDIANDVSNLMSDKAVEIQFCGDRPGQVIRHTGDFGKIERVLGWAPRIDWNTGLRETIQWYTDNSDWWEKQVWLRRVPITTETGQLEFH